MKNVDVINNELSGRLMTLNQIDSYMIQAGYDSILPADEASIVDSGLIWYPFEPFLNQINIWVKVENGKYLIMGVEHFADVEK